MDPKKHTKKKDKNAPDIGSQPLARGALADAQNRDGEQVSIRFIDGENDNMMVVTTTSQLIY